MRAIVLVGAQVLKEIEVEDPPPPEIREPILPSRPVAWFADTVPEQTAFEYLYFECFWHRKLPYCYYLCVNPDVWDKVQADNAASEVSHAPR